MVTKVNIKSKSHFSHLPKHKAIIDFFSVKIAGKIDIAVSKKIKIWRFFTYFCK